MELNQQQKELLLERFSSYLDAGAAAPQTAEVDLYTLFTELAALKAEVKIESRQVKAAIEEFKGLTDLLRNNNDQLNNELARRHRDEEEMRQKIERPLLLELLELRDRINAGATAAEGYRPGLLERRAGQHLDNLRQGMEISLRRVDSLLSQYRVKAVEAVGHPMDPHYMQVIGVEKHPEQEDGIVLAEERRGYLYQNQLLRTAEVVVNKRKDL